MGLTTRKVSAVIPCLNEEESLGICIEKALACFEALGVEGEVVVGDNGSTDRSIEIAEGLGARVAHQSIRGYGAALMAAIEAAEGEFILMADADDSYDWSNLRPFIEKLEAGHDLVMGNRFAGGIEPGAMPFLHYWVGNPFLSTLARLVHNAPIRDFHCGQRGFTKEAFERMKLKTPGMEFATEMVVMAARHGMKVCEVPVKLYPDKRTRPPHLRTFRDGWRHLHFIMTYAPNYLYLLPGALAFLLGVLLQGALWRGPITVAGHYVGIHWLALGVVLTIVGFNIVNLGLLARVSLGRTASYGDALAIWLKRHYRVELGLVIGLLVFLAGFLVDCHLTYRWFTRPETMSATVHVAFVATSAIAVGVTQIFSSFLLGMLLQDWTVKLEAPIPSKES